MHTAELSLLTPVAFPMGHWPLLTGLTLVSWYTALWEKALVTYGALGRPLPLVQDVVAEKCSLVMEAHVTYRALEWALPYM